MANFVYNISWDKMKSLEEMRKALQMKKLAKNKASELVIH